MTVVHRAITRYKRATGNREKLLEVAKDGTRLFPDSLVVRHYVPDIGVSTNTLVFEIEFASYEEYRETWRRWNELEEAADILERWNALVDEMRHELWELHDLRK